MAKSAAAENKSTDQTPDPAPKEDPPAVKAIAEVVQASTKVLSPGRITLAEGAFASHNVVVDVGTTLADLERSDFWVHNTRPLRRGDEVRVTCEDGSFVAYLFVRVVGPKDVLMFVKAFHQLEAVDPDSLGIPSGYSIQWSGDIRQYRVLRGQEELRHGFPNKNAASQWLTNHISSIQR